MSLATRIASPFEFWSSKLKVINPSSPSSGNSDALIIVSPDITGVNIPENSYLKGFVQALITQKENDAGFDECETFLSVAVPGQEHLKKLVFVSTGPLDRHYDDVRRFSDAVCNGIKRALKAGSKRPLLSVLLPQQEKDLAEKFQHYDLASFLGAAEALYVPLEVREDIPKKVSKVDELSVSSFTIENFDARKWSAIELGRIMARDIGGSDPERMSAPNVATYVKEMFSNTVVKVEVVEDVMTIEKDFPLLAAVNRASKDIKRHNARVIFLTYTPQGPVEKTIVLVGKGVTYDTGGADIKTGGGMAGMHRDKCGAATVAGFMQTVAALRPPGLKVVAAMSMVRNSVGSDCYVADEILTSRCGARVRVRNTDAEGRFAMADVLCYMKEKVLEEGLPDPHFFTVATLTGHARLTVGKGYTIMLENGPAEKEGVARQIQSAGYKLGDMIEISTIRREDYDFHKSKSEYDDLLQSNPKGMSNVRGHQGPAAFLIMASGLDKHDINSPTPLKFCHVDIAGSSGYFPGIPSGCLIPSMAAHYCSSSLF